MSARACCALLPDLRRVLRPSHAGSRDSPVIDSSFPCLVVHIEVLQVVVEIDGSSTKVSPEEGSVGGEDGRDVDVSLPAERDGETGLPLVEVGDDC